MARARVLVAAVLAACCFAVLASPALASAPAKKNTKFCNAVSKISSQVQGSNSSSGSAQANALAKSVQKAAKSAPSNVKSALNTMASYFKKLGNAGSNADRLAEAAKQAPKYAKAVVTFEKYYTTNCLGVGS
jgi:hypothetical protein